MPALGQQCADELNTLEHRGSDTDTRCRSQTDAQSPSLRASIAGEPVRAHAPYPRRS